MKLKTIFVFSIILTSQSSLCDTNNQQLGSNLYPLSFGDDQTIIDVKKVIWEPLKVNGLPTGTEIAVLRGSLETGSSESLLRLAPGYKVPIHYHTSDEL